MPVKCIKVKKVDGEAALKLLRRLELNQPHLKIQRQGEYLFIPIARPLTESNRHKLTKALSFLEEAVCRSKTKLRKKSFAETLRSTLPRSLHNYIPRSFDAIGHVAVVELPPELLRYKAAVGRALLETYKNVKVVLAKSSPVNGNFRLRDYNLIGGLDETETIHLEHGCRFQLDVRQAYFSPRLAFEHNRVAKQVHEGEIVLDMFAGVGPFSIQIAKKCSDVKVYAVDANPAALNYLKRNILINRVQGKVVALGGDVANVVGMDLEGKVDRVIMNLPERAFDYLPAACKALKRRGRVHFYSFAEEPEPEKHVITRMKAAVKERCNGKLKVTGWRLVKQTAPRVWLVAVDAQIYISPHQR